MTSQWQVRWRADVDRARRPAEGSRGFPARIAAMIVMLAGLTFADATPQMGLDVAVEQRRTERPVPSACGAEAVARAQREVLGIRPPAPTALS
ncbi:MAG TPA: hypothetical protein VNA44_05835 [Burkholderiaceae bacterium]|nr:hypothetical protein [Burkholderiaceae bacterium]